jgi:hypothetical protein
VTRAGESGGTVRTPPGEEHWQGATTGHMMFHCAMLDGGGDGTTQLDPVAGGLCKTADQR